MNSKEICDKLDNVLPLISPELKARLFALEMANIQQGGWSSEIGYRVLKTIKEHLDKSPQEIVAVIEQWAGEALDHAPN